MGHVLPEHHTRNMGQPHGSQPPNLRGGLGAADSAGSRAEAFVPGPRRLGGLGEEGEGEGHRPVREHADL